MGRGRTIGKDERCISTGICSVVTFRALMTKEIGIGRRLTLGSTRHVRQVIAVALCCIPLPALFDMTRRETPGVEEHAL